MNKIEELVINWHISWSCNYNCKHCFTKYNEKCDNKLLIINSNELIDKTLHKINILTEKYDKLRINIVGGEPLIQKQLNYIIAKADSMGFNVSIVTNGYLMKNLEKLNCDIHKLSMVGLSIDSLNCNTNIQIGRCTNKQDVITKKDIYNMIEYCRKIKSDIKIKINTVITSQNYKEDFNGFIESINPNKWKIFQALSMDKNIIYCSDENYKVFLDNHKGLSHIIYAESTEEIKNSYIMLDPYGKFFQHNKNSDGYEYSPTIFNMEDKQIKSVLFDSKKYIERYKSYASKYMEN